MGMRFVGLDLRDILSLGYQDRAVPKDPGRAPPVGTHSCTTALREHVAPSFYMHIISYAYHFARTTRAGQG